MEYCVLKGFLVVLLMQHSTAEDLSTSIQSSTAVTLQEGQTLPQEQELPPAEVVPVVAPPSLKEVQQAVQEASEQVEGRGAEEVLKELLERVVEAALGQVEGGGEAKVGEAPEQEAVEEEKPEAAKGDAETDTGVAEVLEQGVVEEVEGEDVGGKGGETGVEEVQEVAEVDLFKDEAEVAKGVIEGEVETVAESVGEVAAGVQAGDSEGQGVEVINETPDTKVSQDVVEEALAASVETGGNFVGDAGLVENGAAETETQEVEELPAVVEVAVDGEPEQETLVESDLGLAEQTGEVGGKEEALEGDTQADDIEGEGNVPSSNSYEMETTQTAVGEPVEEEEGVNVVTDTVEPEVEDGQGHVAVEGAAEEMEPEGAGAVESEGGEQVVIKEDSVLINEGVGDQLTGEREIALETSDGSQTEKRVLVISAPEKVMLMSESDADVSVEQSPEGQAPTQSLSLGEVETGGNTLGDQKSDHGNKVITPTDEALPNDPEAAQPTLDHFVKDVAEPAQAEVEEPGQANELVEDSAGSTETTELGLEAWKIGAISAAVFLVLETVIIIIYILKRRNKNSALALQRACEEGCVEPEAATGGDCSDDTLPTGNGDTQQIAALDPSDVASTLAQNKEQHKEEHAISMSDLPPSSTEESPATTGPGPDSPQDLRTSTL
ncbi:high mobility group nucleosome-binding domain-containing protein 5 isoform X2 [Labrus bergylta]|uniref:high mobility group nucleosome-binding domain-containing protein 5 isoform X2 n=1 Tax=Labrus bergylta TaxID=56723 RepID=UPI00331394DD